MTLKIANFELASPLLQAPMAGVTDRVYRDLVREHGAGLATSEMITSDLSLLNTKKTQRRLPQMDECSPRSIQIVGTEPSTMAKAAAFYVDQGAEIIDINFGCPVKKVAGSKKLAGSALLKDEGRVQQIIEHVVAAVDTPVTIKYRTGWDIKSRNAVRIAQIAEDAGVSAIVLHGRTREDKYKPYAEYETIRQTKKYASIPIIANGDICNAKQAAFILDYTQADGLMVGRASFGQPWIFTELNNALFNAQSTPTCEITDSYKREVALRHLKDVYKLHSQVASRLNDCTTNHSRFANKVINWYLLSLSIQTDLRPKILSSKTAREQLSLFEEALFCAQ